MKYQKKENLKKLKKMAEKEKKKKRSDIELTGSTFEQVFGASGPESEESNDQ